jgi:cell division protein FtsI/penicillin-binding protein 2
MRTPDMHHAMVQSCNVYFWKVAEKVGIDGSTTTPGSGLRRAYSGVGINGEAAGFLADRAWYEKKYGDRFLIGYRSTPPSARATRARHAAPARLRLRGPSPTAARSLFAALGGACPRRRARRWTSSCPGRSAASALGGAPCPVFDIVGVVNDPMARPTTPAWRAACVAEDRHRAGLLPQPQARRGPGAHRVL